MRKEELNCVVNAVNEARRRVSVYASTNFTVGQQVEFGRPNGRKHIGNIIKMNAVKAVIKTESQTWRVPYSLMKAVA
jgi:hypothetical protein